MLVTTLVSFMGISVKCDASKMCHSEVNTKNLGTKLTFTSTSLAYVNNEAVPGVCTVYILCLCIYVTLHVTVCDRKMKRYNQIAKL